KIRFISIYIPTNHPELALSTQRVINSWITEAKARNWQCIVLGDFNANHLRRDKCKVIFTHLATLSLNSLLQFHNITAPTWQRGQLSSQIDDIWVSPEITLDIEIPELINPYNITDSDHSIIATTWHTNFIPIRKRHKKRRHK